MKIKLFAAATVAAGCIASLAEPATSASASALYRFDASNVNIRSTPYTNSGTIYGLGQNGQRACVIKTGAGQTISDGGHTTNEWLYVKDLDNGVGPGWVWEWYISGTQIGSC